MIHNYICRYDLISEKNNKKLEKVIDKKNTLFIKTFLVN